MAGEQLRPALLPNTVNLVGNSTLSAAPATKLHFAPNANLADGSYDAAGDPGSIGFNLADVSSGAAADSLPGGVQGLIWLGDDSTAQAESIVTATANDPKVFGYTVADEPTDSQLPTVKTIDDYIAQHAPGKVSEVTALNYGTPLQPDYHITPQNSDAGLIGLDPYPVRPELPNGFDLAVIRDAVQAAEKAGWQHSQIVPIYQAFGQGGTVPADGYDLPTAAQEQQILQTWATVTPNPVFDFAYSWGIQDGDNALVSTPSLQAVFKQLFANEGSSGSSGGGGGPYMQFIGGSPGTPVIYNANTSTTAPAPASNAAPIQYDVGAGMTAVLTISDFREGVDSLALASGAIVTGGIFTNTGALTLNLSTGGRVVLAALTHS